jgi:CheY-like chemotaxis protein
MSSYDVARLLSQHPQLQDLRLIALTKGGRHAGREHAREAGFERYLLKPVSTADLQELLTQPAP